MQMNVTGADLKALKTLRDRSPVIFNKVLSRAAVQLLTWMNTGSPREQATPPIRWGVLRGSGSAYVGKKFIAETSPANSLKAFAGATDMTISIVYATDYAAKMHEWKGGWGEATLRANGAGNKWIEKHLRADKDLLFEFIAKEFGKEAGL